MVILICGLPGSGKTWVAEEISRKMNIPVFRTDEIRKELFREPKYAEREKQLVYRAMFLLAEAFLKNKLNVILDATFSKKSARDRARNIAKRHRTDFKIIEVKCREEILLDRLEKRKTKKRDLSDADKKIYFRIKKEFEPIKEKHMVVDTSGSAQKTKAKISKILRDF